TLAIKACHDFANQYNLKVEQHTGIISITDTITVKTSTNLNGCTLLINKPTQNGKVLYAIESVNAEITVNNYVQSEFVKGASVFPSLSAYKDYYVKIDS